MAAEAKLRSDAPQAVEADRPLTGPWDAFFGVQNLTQDGQTWRDLFNSVHLSHQQLAASRQHPTTLAPLNISLYRGRLFPDAYFMRSTLYWNDYRGQFQRVDFEMPKLSAQMPYITLFAPRRGEPDSQLSKQGGVRELFELLKRHADPEGFITAYRGCSTTEYKLQLFVQELLGQPKHAPLTVAQRQRLAAIMRESSADFPEAADGIEAATPQSTAGSVATGIAQFLGSANRATFVGLSHAKALDFTNSEDLALGKSRVLRYRLPIAQMARHVRRGTLYLGTEFDALEAGFGDIRDQPEDQATKLFLYRSLVPEGLRP